MNDLNPLKSGFWDDVATGVYFTIIIAAVAFFSFLAVRCVWWMCTHGLTGLITAASFIATILILNLLGKIFNRRSL